MLRAAALRPINVTMLVIGAGVFATTLVWWLLPLTIVTYASLVFLAARDPIFQRKVLRLHAAADRLVDVAQGRERAAEVARDLSRYPGSAAPTTARQENLRELENRISTADIEISDTYQELLDLRAKVVRISIDSENPARANDLNASLDGLNARLEALSELMTPQGEPPREY